MKKEGQKGLIGVRRQKSCKQIEEKWQKIELESLTDRIERERVFEKVWKWQNTWKLKVLKKLSMRFSIDQKLDSIDRKLHSIDPKAIEQRSIRTNSNQNYNRIFNWSKKHLWSIENLEKLNFWKTKQLYVETP